MWQWNAQTPAIVVSATRIDEPTSDTPGALTVVRDEAEYEMPIRRNDDGVPPHGICRVERRRVPRPPPVALRHDLEGMAVEMERVITVVERIDDQVKHPCLGIHHAELITQRLIRRGRTRRDVKYRGLAESQRRPRGRVDKHVVLVVACVLHVELDPRGLGGELRILLLGGDK